jgi:hypothetical protein
MLDYQINNAVKEILKYMNNKMEYDLNIGPAVFDSDYDDEKVRIRLLISPKIVKGKFSDYDPQKEEVTIFPYAFYNVLKRGLVPANIIDPLIRELRVTLHHEFAHSIDPKVEIPKHFNAKRKTTKDYLKSQVEFDAISKEISEIIKLRFENIKTFPVADRMKEYQSLIEQIESWLKSDNMNLTLIDSYLNKYNEIILEWRDENPEFVHKLKQRIYYNFIQNNRIGNWI